MDTMGRRIAFYRKKAGFTQEDLAEKCSVTPQAVSKWENDICMPDIAQIPVLAGLFDITCDELFGVERQTNRQPVDSSGLCVALRAESSERDSVDLHLPFETALAMLTTKFIDKTKFINFDGRNPFSDINLEKIISMANAGAIGKILEAESSEGDHVSVVLYRP